MFGTYAFSDKAVSHLPLSAEARVRPQASPCVICGAHRVNGIGWCQCTWPFRVSIVLPMLCTQSSDILSPMLYDSNN
jgi:hypothetical protein